MFKAQDKTLLHWKELHGKYNSGYICCMLISSYDFLGTKVRTCFTFNREEMTMKFLNLSGPRVTQVSLFFKFIKIKCSRLCHCNITKLKLFVSFLFQLQAPRIQSSSVQVSSLPIKVEVTDYCSRVIACNSCDLSCGAENDKPGNSTLELILYKFYICCH